MAFLQLSPEAAMLPQPSAETHPPPCPLLTASRTTWEHFCLANRYTCINILYKLNVHLIWNVFQYFNLGWLLLGLIAERPWLALNCRGLIIYGVKVIIPLTIFPAWHLILQQCQITDTCRLGHPKLLYSLVFTKHSSISSFAFSPTAKYTAVQQLSA